MMMMSAGSDRIEGVAPFPKLCDGGGGLVVGPKEWVYDGGLVVLLALVLFL